MKMGSVLSKEYFASLEIGDPRLADEMLQRVRTWREWCDGRGLTTLWNKKLKNYYGMSTGGYSSQAVTRGGAEGELNLIKVNDLHNLVQNQLVIVTSQRPAGIAHAINADPSSLKSARIGTALAEYYMTEADFESYFLRATHTALLCDEAFVDLYWDKRAGDPVRIDMETNEPIMSGDLRVRTHCSWMVSRDPGIVISDSKWFIITIVTNKFDEAARYPRFKDAILFGKQESLPSLPMEELPDGSDAIFKHLLIHDRTPACPEGRYSIMINGTVVFDAPLPYKDFPVDRITAEDVIQGCIGYCSANDIMAMEEVTDALHSAVVTNQVNYAGQNIVGPEGANLKISDLAKGSRYFELPPDLVDKLRPLQLTSTPPEVFNYLGILGNKKEQSVGVNSVVRGQPEGALSGASGAALALIQTQAIAFNSGLQRSYFKLLSRSMTKAIGILRSYADTPRIARIVGKSKGEGLKQFKYTGRDLNSISTIVYEMVNPLMQTFGGRMQMADNLLAKGVIKSPKQYITLATTGSLEPMIQDDEADQMSILEENERLLDGRFVQAVITENHADHIKSHLSLITPEAKEKSPDMCDRALDHVQDHLNTWMQASINNPGILIATGQQPLPPPMMPGMPGPMGPGGAQPGPQSAPEGNMPELGGSGAPGVALRAQEVNQPNLPNIAGTDQQPTVPGVNA